MTKKTNDSWGKPKNLDDVNSKEMDACVGVSVDGEKMFMFCSKPKKFFSKVISIVSTSNARSIFMSLLIDLLIIRSIQPKYLLFLLIFRQ